MTALRRRLDALEKPTRFATLGMVLDSLDGEPLPDGLPVDPALVAALDVLPFD
ncbi:hypothetical protein KYN89_02455 [Alteriqipengyuania sp. NZ-12B]|uniref:Uncharacterized protein n=1 Tax=Alteriqipengyuania abyssalis TaxID=2860200 RepID=A0ABS7PDL9_9SPHN|nr:hypothetical protein [Alteriqipengyuania abyssalis]MBY8335902.1 hypothetical protein [Alteriqipengyuania abyssalis]